MLYKKLRESCSKPKTVSRIQKSQVHPAQGLPASLVLNQD